MDKTRTPSTLTGRLARRSAVCLAALGVFGAHADEAKSPSDQTDSLQVARAIMSPAAEADSGGAAAVPRGPVSRATDPRAYRKDAAGHLYGLNRNRIFKGKMPPLLYAVGVLQVEVDQVGQVLTLNWMRAPNHAPEVMAEIERTVRAAAPFPAPAQIGRVVYTDVWLWHKSGRFQLDTLTEGQH